MKLPLRFSKKNIYVSICPGIVLGLMLVFGFLIRRDHGLHFNGIKAVISLISCIISTFAIAVIFSACDFFAEKNKGRMANDKIPFFNRKFKKTGLFYLFIVVVLCAVWMPVYLALYPGLFCYDASWQYFMYISNEVTAHHPIIHTYLLGFLIELGRGVTGSMNKGVALYFMVQMLIMALGVGFIFSTFHRRKAPTGLMIFAFLFFGFYPTFVIFVFTAVKDSFFAVAVADLILLSLSLIEDKKLFFDSKRNCILWVVFAFEVSVLRNNAVYAAIPALIWMIIKICKSNCSKVKAFATIGVTIVLYLLYRYPITNSLTVQGTSEAEMLSIPCQQIMRIYKYRTDEMSLEEKELVEKFFDSDLWYGYYVPEVADATKGSLRMDVFSENKGEFISFWISLVKQYPEECIDSFLENTYGFWYPFPHYVIFSFGQAAYTSMQCYDPAEFNTKIPLLFNFYKQFEDGDIVQAGNALSMLFSPALFFYIAALYGIYILKDKGGRYAVPFAFILLLWLTYILGPIAMPRYALYLYALLPVWPEYMRSKKMYVANRSFGTDER